MNRLKKVQPGEEIPDSPVIDNTPKVRYRVLGSYTKESPAELTIREGDVLFVLEQHDSGWWKVL